MDLRIHIIMHHIYVESRAIFPPQNLPDWYGFTNTHTKIFFSNLFAYARKKLHYKTHL